MPAAAKGDVKGEVSSDRPEPVPEALAALVEACWAQLPVDRPPAAQVFETFDQRVAPALADKDQADNDVAVLVAPPSTQTMRGFLEPLGLAQ
jgi:hypothetical protein